MSRINVANFRHPDGTDDNITLDSSGRVGVGTASPINALHINGAAGEVSSRFRLSSTEGSGFTIRSESSTETMLNVDSSENLLFGVGGAEKVRIDSDGRLLVATPSDFSGSTNGLLQATSGGGAELALGRTSTSALGAGSGLGRIKFYSNAGSVYEPSAEIACLTDATQGSGDKPGRLVFSTTADGASSPTERMRIDANGNVEIRANSNTVSTGASLYLFDTVAAAGSGNSSGRICFYSSDSTDGASIRSEISNNYENSSADSALLFKTYNGTLAERLRIESGGKTKFSGGAYGIERTATAAAFDLNTGNFWTCGAIAIPNPTNGVAGMSGLIRVTAAPTSFGSNWDFPGGSYTAPTTFPAVAPFYCVNSTTFYLGNWTEGIT